MKPSTFFALLGGLIVGSMASHSAIAVTVALFAAALSGYFLGRKEKPGRRANRTAKTSPKGIALVPAAAAPKMSQLEIDLASGLHNLGMRDAKKVSARLVRDFPAADLSTLLRLGFTTKTA